MNQSIMLSFHDGSVERLCHLSLKARGEGYIVHVARGRRGLALRTETKTATPVSYAEAWQIYAAELAEQTAQGYRAEPFSWSEGVSPATTRAVRHRPLRPIRPIAIDPAAVGPLIADPDWWMQERYRGRHLVIRKLGAAIDAIDGDARPVPLPAAVIAAVARIPLRCVLEGVCQEEVFTVFDLPQFEMLEYGSLAYDIRWQGLRQLLPPAEPHLRLAETAIGLDAKVALLQRLRTGGRAGFVLKKRTGVTHHGELTIEGYLLQCTFAEPAATKTGDLPAESGGPARA